MRRERWWVHELDRREREHAAERARWDEERRELLNRIMYLANRTWETPTEPQIVAVAEPEEEFELPELAALDEGF